MLSFYEVAKKHGIRYADTIIDECKPLIFELRTKEGENNSTYREYSNKVVDTAITLILLQVNGNLGLSMASDLSQVQKRELINQNSNALNILNKVESLYKTNETQGSINSIKNKIKGSESRVNPNSSCYIATLIYNDYNCLEVCLLRVYRDSVLSKTYVGRLFTQLYYKSNPIVTPILTKFGFLQKYIKVAIDLFIKKRLNESVIK
jgi:hypothetical protein